MFKKAVSLILLISTFCFSNGVYAETIKVKQSNNTYYDALNYIEFDDSTTVYNDTPATQTVQTSQNVNSPIKLRVVKLIRGSSINVFIQDAIDTAYAEVGQDIMTMTKEDYVVNNHIIIPQGSYIRGKVVSARHAGAAGRNGKVSIAFDSLILPEGETYKINAEKVDFEVTDSGEVHSTAAVSAGAIILGSAIGSIMTSSSEGQYTAKKAEDYGRGALSGAIITGALVAGYLLMRKGQDAVIPQYSEITIKLTDDLTIEDYGKY